jgi:glycerol-3-phosphate dehydrogenase
MNVEMPLCTGVYRVLYEGVPAHDAVHELMTRPIKPETD